MSDRQKYDPIDPKGHLRRLRERMEANDKANANIQVNVFLSESAGSDPLVIAKISHALEKNLPFGLRCQRSSVIFIPHKFKAYWVWSDDTHGPVFTYTCKDDLVRGVKMQYLSHKEFITTAECAAKAKIIFYERALETLEQARRLPLPEPAEPTGSLEIGDGGISAGGIDSGTVLQHPGRESAPIVLPESIRDAEDIPGDGKEDGPAAGG